MEEFLDSKLHSQNISVPLRKTTQASRSASPNLRLTVFQRDNFQCCYPGCTNQMNLELDHVVPYSKKGKTELNNLRVLSKAHNLARNLGLII